MVAWCVGLAILLEHKEEKVVELLCYISSFSPSLNSTDKWVWTKEGSSLYSVSSTYDYIQDKSTRAEANKLWTAKAPSNVVALAGKVLVDRIQTKAFLDRRNALPNGSSTDCVLCEGGYEIGNNLFLTCHTSWKLWSKVCDWLGFFWVVPSTVGEHFMYFGASISGSKVRKVLTLIWIATVGVIWQVRNGVVFNGVEVNLVKALDLIQFRVLMWLKVRGN